MLAVTAHATAQTPASVSPEKLAELKQQAVQGVEQRRKLAQVMSDKIFSFSELAFQEFETSKYITDVLEKNGFAEEGFAESYLQINGKWEDHVLFGLTRERYDMTRFTGGRL
jgi:metal-dependent amidase/aminoacylase/carboxypeptidase family protein